MEIGDLFYIIILSLFMILGFFNDLRKKKNEQKQQSQPKTHTYQSDEPDVIPPLYKKNTPLDPDILKRKKSRERESSNEYSKEGNIVFQSSMNLLTDFSKESSLKSSIYVNDTGETYTQNAESDNSMEIYDNNIILGNDIINDLTGDNKRNELVKGIIYSEILKRKS